MTLPEPVERSTAYQGRVLRVVREVFALDGRKLVRETIHHPGSVVIVPILPDGRVLFIRQYRRAAGRWLLELPAGTLTPGEDRRRCAHRELIEETGWRAKRLERLAKFYPAPGFLAEQMTIFLGTGLIAGVARPEPDEFLQPMPLGFTQALAKIRAGTICDAKSMLGTWLAAERLRRRRRA